MPDEEIRRVQCDMSFEKNVAPIWDCGTSDFNGKSQYSQDRDRPPDADDGNNPANELLTAEGEAWQNESIELIPRESRLISRTNGMSFNMAHFISTAEFDDELSDLFPLGY